MAPIMFPDFNSKSLCAVKINDSNIVRGFEQRTDIFCFINSQTEFGSDTGWDLLSCCLVFGLEDSWYSAISIARLGKSLSCCFDFQRCTNLCIHLAKVDSAFRGRPIKEKLKLQFQKNICARLFGFLGQWIYVNLQIFWQAVSGCHQFIMTKYVRSCP